jgi:hypothetical protein
MCGCAAICRRLSALIQAGRRSGDAVSQHELGRAHRRAKSHNRKERDRIVFSDGDVNALYAYGLTGEPIQAHLRRTTQLAPAYFLRSHDRAPRIQDRDNPKAIRVNASLGCPSSDGLVQDPHTAPDHVRKAHAGSKILPRNRAHLSAGRRRGPEPGSIRRHLGAQERGGTSEQNQ